MHLAAQQKVRARKGFFFGGQGELTMKGIEKPVRPHELSWPVKIPRRL